MRGCARPVVFLALVLALASPAIAEDDLLRAARAEERRLTQAIQSALKAFVFVGGGGSGVLISPDGFILTNDHVAGGAHKWRVRTSDGALRYARLVGTDPFGDVALLKIDGVKALPYLEMGDADKLKTGQPVLAIGNPFALSNMDEKPTVTIGVVSALHRYNRSRYTDAIMTDAALNPGNSGGPLITMNGLLVGINGQIRTRFEVRSNTGIGYAITTNQIQNFLPVLKKARGGFVKHGYIPGLAVSSPDSLVRPPRVGGVDKKSLAEKVGFKKGDRLLAINGRETKTTNRFYGLMLTFPAGKRISVTVERDGGRLEIPVSLDPVPIPGEPDLGVSFLKVGAAANSLVVNKVVADSQAAKAGLKVGDRLISMAGVEIGDAPPGMLRTYLAGQFKAHALTGSLVELTVFRAGVQKQLVLDIPQGNKVIGFSMGPTDDAKKVDPLTIAVVNEGSLAARAGLKVGDLVLGIDDEQANNLEGYQKLLSKHRPGDPVEVAIRRGGKVKVLVVILGMKREMP